MTLDSPSILAWSLVGMLTGATATQLLTSRGYGDGGDSGIGFLGALVGGLLVSLLGIQGQGGLVASTAAAFVGAILLIGLAWAVQRRASAGELRDATAVLPDRHTGEREAMTRSRCKPSQCLLALAHLR